MNLFVSLLPLIVLFACFTFFSFVQRVQAKRHKEMLAALKKGDKVVSLGGLICEIIKVEVGFERATVAMRAMPSL